MKYGKDYKDYTYDQALELLQREGFRLQPEKRQGFPHRTLHHLINESTTQRATISVVDKTGVATVSYSKLKKDHRPRRTSEQIARDNFVLYD
jgi:hypothetical protein